MKHALIAGVVIVAITAMLSAVAQAACSPAATTGDDLVVCTGIVSIFDGDDGNDIITNDGTITDDLLGGDDDDILINNGSVNDEMRGGNGNDMLINNGFVGDDMEGDSGNDTLVNFGTVADEMRGEDGNDTLINYGTVDDDMQGDDGDDLLINYGTVGDDMQGNDGNDTLVNFGIVDNDMEGNDGNDLIVNAGHVGDDILGGSGNDHVIISNGTVDGRIDGDSGFDTLEFDASVCYGSSSEFVADFLAIRGLNPNSDTATYNGNTYTWEEFEVLLVSLYMQFCDGRNEILDAATPLVSYCNQFGGLDVYDVNEIGVDGRSTEGLLTIRTTQAEARAAVQLAISSGQNQLIGSDNLGNSLYALSSNELQIMGPEVNEPTKMYVLILPTSTCGIN